MGDTVDGAGINGTKRVRGASDGSPEAKRLCAAGRILLDILEDVDSADQNLVVPAAGDLAVVLKSFEEEIAALSPHHSPEQQEQQQGGDGTFRPPLSTSTSDSDEPRQFDLDYLLEASDDELGLPPTAPSSEEREAVEDDLGKEAATQGPAGFWGFDDDIPNYYDSLGFGAFGQVACDRAGAGDTVVVDVGLLFEYPDAGFSNSSWRTESLPAV